MPFLECYADFFVKSVNLEIKKQPANEILHKKSLISEKRLNKSTGMCYNDNGVVCAIMKGAITYGAKYKKKKERQQQAC